MAAFLRQAAAHKKKRSAWDTLEGAASDSSHSDFTFSSLHAADSRCRHGC